MDDDDDDDNDDNNKKKSDLISGFYVFITPPRLDFFFKSDNAAGSCKFTLLIFSYINITILLQNKYIKYSNFLIP